MKMQSQATKEGPAHQRPGPRGNLPAWLGGLFGRSRLQIHHWVRLALYSVLLLVGGLTYWQTRQLDDSELVRATDAQIIRISTNQGALIQHMSLLLTRLQTGQGQPLEILRALEQDLSQARAQARQLDGLLVQQGVWTIDDLPQLRQAIFIWQDQREGIWNRLKGLIHLNEPADAAKRGAMTGLLLVDLARFWETTQFLAEELEQAAQRRSHESRVQVERAGLFMGGLLLLLILLVAEPLARFVRRQSEALRRQSDEVRRLAMVAQRTSNWVAIVDQRRRVVWANDAFLRGKQQTLAQVQGKIPGLLRANAGNDAAEIERLLTELDYGLGVRVEIMYDAPDGREVWLDVDYQPFQDDDGKLIGYTVVAADISERVNQRQRMRILLDALPAGVVLYGKTGQVLECNAAASNMLGLPRHELVGRPELAREGIAVREDLSPYPANERPSRRTLKSGIGLRGETMGLLSPEGGLKWLMINTETIKDTSGHLTGVISCMIDVTEQRAQQQLLALAIESASLGVWQWDIGSGTLSGNHWFMGLFGLLPGEIEMKSEVLSALVHPDDVETWNRAILANMRDSRQPLHHEIRVRHVDGRWVWGMFSGTVVARNTQGLALRMAGICYDVTAQKEFESQLKETALTDSLTQLPNRIELLRRIQALIDRARAQPGYCFAVLFMDFDRFKQVNDTLGHSVGDELLRQIAQRLQDSLRPGDAYVQTSDYQQMAARIGGDEFVVLLDNIRGDLDAQVVAARLLDVLAAPYRIGVHQVTSTASIGIVTTSNMAEDPDSVLRDADIAMYEAKRQGRGRYVMFDPSMRKRVHDDVALENELRLALDRNELSVVYQPIMDLRTARLVGVEALVRWQHPRHGLVSPMVFIPVAEACGLIGRLGEFVLKTACHELVRLRTLLGANAPETVSVNLSRAQLHEPDFTARLSTLLYHSGLAPSSLILEVTESLAAQDEGIQATLRDIRALGVTLSLDDFGTGYSSLACLHLLPVNQVKIDRSFVSLALESDYHRVMIEATIRMAQTLGLQTVAEGIETQEQAELMAAQGCNKGQGYLFSRPLPAADLERWAQDAQNRALRT